MSKYKEQIAYLFFGVCSTILNIWVFYVLTHLFPTVKEAILDVPAELSAIIFAYITNKLWVFEKTNKPVIKELLEFLVGRMFTLIVSMAMIYVLVDIISFPSLIIKVITTVVVVVLNYILSKFWIFKVG